MTRKTKIAILVSIAAVCIVFLVLLVTVFLPNRRSAKPAVGETIRFGRYEQDGDLTNGSEEIEWIVLDVEDGKALLISKYGLDLKEFNDEKSPYVAITWWNCQLRKWLNQSFLNTAFDDGEQRRILSSKVTADRNPDSKVKPGRDTNDQIFLLSMQEAYRYFDSDQARQCFGTEFCYASGAEKGQGGACLWWLRTPGIETSTVSVVLDDGSVFPNGFSSGHLPNLAIRPAMWIDLNANP